MRNTCLIEVILFFSAFFSFFSALLWEGKKDDRLTAFPSTSGANENRKKIGVELIAIIGTWMDLLRVGGWRRLRK